MRREREVRIKEGSPWARCAAWVLRADSVALTLGHTIHLHNAGVVEFRSDRRWVLHELKHVEQFRRYGFWLFLFLYLIESIRKGYHDNRFEVEAREAENPFAAFGCDAEPSPWVQASEDDSHSISPCRKRFGGGQDSKIRPS